MEGLQGKEGTFLKSSLFPFPKKFSFFLNFRSKFCLTSVIDNIELTIKGGYVSRANEIFMFYMRGARVMFFPVYFSFPKTFHVMVPL